MEDRGWKMEDRRGSENYFASSPRRRRPIAPSPLRPFTCPSAPPPPLPFR